MYSPSHISDCATEFTYMVNDAHTAKAGKGIETADDLSAANRQVGASLSQWQKPSDSCSHGCLLSKMSHAIRTVRVSLSFCQLWNKRATRSTTALSTWLILDCPRRVGG
ncbi:hypothetical protein [Nostoc sp.]|uniref:hypothetical protein n=1 Tax=Nostoc sp. TaxID=1180 RepID=UPI002FF8BB51